MAAVRKQKSSFWTNSKWLTTFTRCSNFFISQMQIAIIHVIIVRDTFLRDTWLRESRSVATFWEAWCLWVPWYSIWLF